MFDFEDGLTAFTDVAITLIALLIAVVVLEVVLYLVLIRWRRSRLAVPLMLLAPGFVAVILLYGYPLLYELNMSFTKMNIRNFIQPGLLGLTWEGTPLAGTPLAAEKRHLRRVPELHRRLHQARPEADQLLPALLRRRSFGRWSTSFSMSCLGSAWRSCSIARCVAERSTGRAHPALGHPDRGLAAGLANGVQLRVRCHQSDARDHRSGPCALDDQMPSGTSRP